MRWQEGGETMQSFKEETKHQRQPHLTYPGWCGSYFLNQWKTINYDEIKTRVKEDMSLNSRGRQHRNGACPRWLGSNQRTASGNWPRNGASSTRPVTGEQEWQSLLAMETDLISIFHTSPTEEVYILLTIQVIVIMKKGFK